GSFPREAFVAGSDIIGSRLSLSTAHDVVSTVARRGRAGGGGALLLDALGGRICALAPGDTAFRWRTALASAQWYVGLPTDAGTTGIASGRRWIADGHRALRPVSAGGYVNYLEPGRPVASYYGRNVGRMRRLRARYDPEGVFDSPWSV
ncbi:MAG: BBE domain-containing protein, partial [Nocardioidaceae bacterium]